MKSKRRCWQLVGALLLSIVLPCAYAQYPQRPISLIVPAFRSLVGLEG